MSNHTSEVGTTRLADAATHAAHDGRLDRERAASMADEGGVSGAIMERREDAIVQRDFNQRRAWRARWLWGAVALGCAVFAGTLVLRSARS